jgi:hypothetical protein
MVTPIPAPHRRGESPRDALFHGDHSTTMSQANQAQRVEEPCGGVPWHSGMPAAHTHHGLLPTTWDPGQWFFKKANRAILEKPEAPAGDFSAFPLPQLQVALCDVFLPWVPSGCSLVTFDLCHNECSHFPSRSARTWRCSIA